MAEKNIIDVHAHALPASYLEGLEELGVSPKEEDGFPTPSWSEEAALEFVESQGIGYSVLTISTPHINRGDDELACKLARRIDDELARFCSAHPDRFGFAATLPLPCVDGSIAEARRCFDELGAVGVKVPSNAHGVYLGDKSYEPLMEVLDEYKAVVTIHPSLAQDYPHGIFTAGPAPLFEYIVDTTRSVLNLIASGTVERYPNVRWVVPHCGSFLPEVAHRLMGISKVLVPAGMMEEIDVLGNLRSLYYDLAGDAEPVMAAALLKIADPEHLLYGSDFPYTPAKAIAGKREGLLADPDLAPYAQGILHDNAARLYGLDD
jgi:predicted TIM-barrel fold metal-dependent hydrolase